MKRRVVNLGGTMPRLSPPGQARPRMWGMERFFHRSACGFGILAHLVAPIGCKACLTRQKGAGWM